MTGAWSEIRELEGELGPKFATLLYATVDAVRRFNRYPPPQSRAAWSTDLIQDVAHQYLAAERTKARLGRLVATATTDDSFERLLQKDVKNWFLMQARATDTGALLAALRHAIEQNDRIVKGGTTPGTRTWALVEHAALLPYSGPLRPLVDAAYSVENVRAARWRLDARHRQPIAEADALQRVIEAVLDAARAPLAPLHLAQVIQARFPATTSMSAEDSLSDADVAAGDPSRDDEIVADAIWADLSDNERLVVGISDQTVRQVSSASGLSRGTAHRAMQSAATTVAVHLQGHTSPDGAIRAVSDRSAAARGGTNVRGSASGTSEEDTPNG
jgi:hypothetical protein